MSAAVGDVAQRFVTPDAYTPQRLVQKILSSKTALEGERKQLTVLFADLKASMKLLANRGTPPLLEHGVIRHLALSLPQTSHAR